MTQITIVLNCFDWKRDEECLFFWGVDLQEQRSLGFQVYILYIRSNYSDLTRPFSPKWWFSKGNPFISGKSRLVKYDSIWPDNICSLITQIYTTRCPRKKLNAASTWPLTSLWPRSPSSATALMPCGIGRPWGETWKMDRPEKTLLGCPAGT